MRFPAWGQYRVMGRDIQGSNPALLAWRRLQPAGVRTYQDQKPQAEACATGLAWPSSVARSHAKPIGNDHC